MTSRTFDGAMDDTPLEKTIHDLEALEKQQEEGCQRLREALNSRPVRMLLMRYSSQLAVAVDELASTRRKLAAARAELDVRDRSAGDQLAQRTIAANERMAEASETAARASADAARWAKWAAVFTAIAAAVTLATGVAQCRGSPVPQPSPTPTKAGR